MSHDRLPATRPTNPALLPALKCHDPPPTWKIAFCLHVSILGLCLGPGRDTALEGVRASGRLSWAMVPPNPARREGPERPHGGLRNATLAQGVPLKGWAVETQERMLSAAHSPTFPLISPWVMNSPVISAVIQGWAKFLCLAAAGCVTRRSPGHPDKFLTSL